MHIAILAKKGGVGKSTLALLLHESLRQAGRAVAIRDWDAQGTSSKALALTGGQAAALDADYAVLIYDMPPSLEHVATGYAVSDADLWEASEAAKFARSKNKKAPVRLVFNKVRRGTVLGRMVEDSAKQVSVQALGPMLSARECYQHALAHCWKALDNAARTEVLELTVALLALKK